MTVLGRKKFLVCFFACFACFFFCLLFFFSRFISTLTGERAQEGGDVAGRRTSDAELFQHFWPGL